MYVVAIIVDSVLYIIFLFLFIIGLLCVSAGENSSIPIIDISPIISFIVIFSFVFIAISGIPMNDSVDDIKHIQLFFACIPNDGARIIVYINMNIMYSFVMFNNIAIIVITISFVIIKYNPSSPYLISASFVLS